MDRILRCVPTDGAEVTRIFPCCAPGSIYACDLLTMGDEKICTNRQSDARSISRGVSKRQRLGLLSKSELLAITENISMQCVNATNHAASPVAPGGIITVRANQTLIEEINV